jgi:histidine triad (HIT) family protein
MKMSDCIFCKIINQEIPTELKYSDENVVAFADIEPQAPVHILIVPRKHINNLNEAGEDIIGQCVGAAKKLAAQLGIDDEGYRIVVNCNKYGGQAVDHLHVHLLGGRQMIWPPG